ncbi:MAG: 16S rRNA (cytidine(1402)-2'-O)-methyltransferase [Cytophagaceae bacterium]|nr:16S rRNA (cytidine(1402)-2'-O)-methyltransferase [Cytophagaceae bacterium]MBK9509604.1 16S rRNA (cytidine(1402)-2'-O)-methyltransferase [Cytophagaceae bacterium]MBK9936186.1 16S rRNA (cytidine(1402)-2'-O)-methyltransferase [Cytophagaceae bacterium]MBL0303926.1 16S rRNA (cytidine(1402)-2'-O)-methyltransferase [Cytophagaceae bacterium]MBL0326739.1 16S rRNA (cytidine(1402)-2'-O)-methyltransferase [Cytophagaceae bacterium]
MPLILVPTPIGNLKDMTIRALENLKEADLILAEDTRTSGILLKHFEISRPLQSYHIFNEHKTVDKIITELKKDKKIVLISDAGTPGISDPGFLIVRECIQNQIEVICLPGATALIPALVISGLPTDSFVFEGFLPVKKGRQTKLTELKTEPRTMVFYESPHRLVKTLENFIEYFGENRRVSVSREISKLHEETLRGTLSEILTIFANRTIKGEIVIVLEGNNSKKKDYERE